MQGQTVGGYRIERLIAEGGMGAVYAASHVVLPRRAAVKVMHASMLGRAHATERTLQEAQILERIASPTVASIYDAGVLPDGRAWVAMELLEGPTLFELLTERGRLPALEVARIALAVTDALAQAHRQGVFHRDIKPDNILVLADDRVKLIDWGIARVGHNRRLTDVDSAPGTPQYMSPEQVRGEAIDGRTDIYALGVLMYELLVGTPPYLGSTAVEIALQHVTKRPVRIGPIVPGLPTELDDLILEMRARCPDDRPSLPVLRARLDALVQALGEDYASFEIAFDFGDVHVDVDPIAQVPTARIKWTPQVRRMEIRSSERDAEVAGEIIARAR